MHIFNIFLSKPVTTCGIMITSYQIMRYFSVFILKTCKYYLFNWLGTGLFSIYMFYRVFSKNMGMSTHRKLVNRGFLCVFSVFNYKAFC